MEKRKLLLNKRKANAGSCILYIMSRDQRVQDNHALLLAQQSALESKLPLMVLFNLLPHSGVRAREHYQFMNGGLKQLEESLSELNIGFALTFGQSVGQIKDVTRRLKPREIFFDFSPLRGPRAAQKNFAAETDIPCSVVDTHNIIPSWILSDKEEFAAHTIRRKVHQKLGDWLAEPDGLQEHPYSPKNLSLKADWNRSDELINKLEGNGSNLDFAPGEAAAHKALRDFIQNRLDSYATERNLPDRDSQSGLSPYLHFGHVSALRVALEVLKTSDQQPLILKAAKIPSLHDQPTRQDSINAFLEELIVRKELADNFCFYNKNYDSLEGARDWALESLVKHKDDAREFVYPLDDWEQAKTHDDAWNAAQQQMMHTGKMHGYMRMYWAKKILEWSTSPEEAIQIAVYLNDRYSLDGGDPNGYTGIMWSIAGVHDRPWFERDVYGKIRYMNRNGLAEKFDLDSYVQQQD